MSYEFGNYPSSWTWSSEFELFIGGKKVTLLRHADFTRNNEPCRKRDM